MILENKKDYFEPKKEKKSVIEENSGIRISIDDMQNAIINEQLGVFELFTKEFWNYIEQLKQIEDEKFGNIHKEYIKDVVEIYNGLQKGEIYALNYIDILNSFKDKYRKYIFDVLKHLKFLKNQINIGNIELKKLFDKYNIIYNLLSKIIRKLNDIGSIFINLIEEINKNGTIYMNQYKEIDVNNEDQDWLDKFDDELDKAFG